MLEIKSVENYKDYGRVVSISNGVIEAFVTVDVGPRIIRFGFIGGNNILCDDRKNAGSRTDSEFEEYFGKGKVWENMGGHRIWTSPESYPECYYPDKETVTVTKTETGAVFTPKAETENGIQKELEIKMDNDDSNMQVTMRVTNISGQDKEFAVWGLSVCAKGGTLIIPMNDNDTGLLSNRKIVVWPYTDLRDKRIHIGHKYFCLDQDINAKLPIKLGFDLNKATAYYNLADDIFCKRIESNMPNGVYADGGCNFETYTNETFIEVESLGELKTVKAGQTALLNEYWSLYKKPCEVDFDDDASIDNLLSNI
ncbi:MAG: hypothetical protein IJZ75_02065 [Clostridia bacterium]|nr:hypothetical protein [Clostridia bacterium]